MQYLNEENTVNIAAQAKDNSLSSFSAAATDTNTASDMQKAKISEYLFDGVYTGSLLCGPRDRE